MPYDKKCYERTKERWAARSKAWKLNNVDRVNENRRRLYAETHGGVVGLFRTGRVRYRYLPWFKAVVIERYQQGFNTRMVGNEFGISSGTVLGFLKAANIPIRPRRLGWERLHPKTFSIWTSVIKRTTRPSTHNWASYGGRGIKVCERWRLFENFLADMGECPKGLSIHRVDNDGHYEPRNCIWATPKIQANTKRSCVVLSFHGKQMNITQWAEHLGIDRVLIYNRLKQGWSAEKALTVPIKEVVA